MFPKPISELKIVAMILVMYFGLTNTPMTFMDLMNRVSEITLTHLLLFSLMIILYTPKMNMSIRVT